MLENIQKRNLQVDRIVPFHFLVGGSLSDLARDAAETERLLRIYHEQLQKSSNGASR